MMRFLKACFKKENIFYTIVFLLDIIIILLNRGVQGFYNILWIADFASLFSILYAIFTAKHSILGLYFNLIASLILGIMNLVQHVWLNMIICLCVSVPMLTSGIFTWKKDQIKEDKKKIKRLSKNAIIKLFVLYAVLSGVFSVILYYLNGNLFYLDALYSAGCVFGIILLSLGYLNNFMFFIVADVFGIVMYLMLSIQNINNLPVLFTTLIFLIVNTMGLFNWRKIDKNLKEEKEKPSEG